MIRWCRSGMRSRNSVFTTEARRARRTSNQVRQWAIMPTVSQLRNILVLIACCIAAYLSFVAYGGYLVFGFQNFADFCFIAVPLFALPVALLGFRYTRISTALSLVIMVLYFGVQIYHFGPPWSAVLHNGTQFYKFLTVTVLLGAAAVLERRRLGLSKA